MELATDLKVGERVRLISEKGHRAVHELLEVENGRFRTDFAADGDVVFVYGREVKDFRSVDYEAIAMLNVSATQQLKKEKDAELQTRREQNATLTQKNATLARRLAALEQAGTALQTRLGKLEQALTTLAANRAITPATTPKSAARYHIAPPH